MDTGQVRRTDHGLWSVAILVGHADLLLAALDPDAPFVLIETSDGRPEWHEAEVSIGVDDEPRPRLVRRHSFDLLVTPAEATDIGRLIRARGDVAGGFECFQFRQRPPADFQLPDSPRGRADAMRGRGVELTIDHPHNGEVAVVSAPTREAVDGYLLRLS